MLDVFGKTTRATPDDVIRMRRLADFILGYYRTFGLSATIKFATRPPVRIGSDATWDRAESGLRAALDATGLPYELKPGDGAFYGPKIDFDVADSIGRKWQLGTIQLDYEAPERFKLHYVGEDNHEHRPVVIHRAVSGSFERFMAILIEHFAGAFPVWLAPAVPGGRHPGAPRRGEPDAQLPHPGGRGSEGPLHGGDRPAGGGGRHGGGSGPGSGQQTGNPQGR